MGIFGPSKREIWEQFSNEIGAQYISGSLFKNDRVEFLFQSWLIVLDTYVVSTGKSAITYTRIRSPFITNENFNFHIYKKGFFSSVAKFFGSESIETGDFEFDEQFIIKSSSQKKVLELLCHDGIKCLMLSQPSFDLYIKDDEGFFGSNFPHNVDELYFQVTGVIKDIERLKSLFNLFCSILIALFDMGIISEENPNVKLK